MIQMYFGLVGRERGCTLLRSCVRSKILFVLHVDEGVNGGWETSNRGVRIRAKPYFPPATDVGYWKEDVSFLLPAPRLYGDQVPVRLIRTNNDKVQEKIVDTHNYFRMQVEPSAANMLIMVRTSIRLLRLCN